MKVLVLQVAHFRLPDDFQGTLSDGLRLLADYHDSMTGKSNQELAPLDKNVSDVSFKQANTILFDRFLDSVKRGCRFLGTVQLVSYDPGFEPGALDVIS